MICLYRRRCVLLLLLAALAAPALLAQETEPPPADLRTDNVRVRGTDQGRIYIVYDLVGDSEVITGFEITAAVSLDGGATFVPLRAVIGDVGSGIEPGPGKEIVWTVQEDLPDGVGEAELVFQVTVVLERAPSRTWLYVLGGAVVAGLGTTAALLLGGSGDDRPDVTTSPPVSIPTPVGRPGN
ncbi:MAG: hypothetical protein AAGF99_12450 [Bacteroidota bacterium]